MWIDRQVYDQLQKQLIAAQAHVVAETGANKAIRESNNWLMLRVTQLEKERAVFVERMFGVKIAVPEIAPRSLAPDPFASHPLNETFSFEDVGDDAARDQGIDYDSEGKVVYTK